MSKELVNKVARAIAHHVNGWTTSFMEDIDFSNPGGDFSVRALTNAAVAAIQAMTPQDKPGSPACALRAAAAFIKLHSMDAPPCFTPKDEVVALAVRARQGHKEALTQLLALVEEAEGVAPPALAPSLTPAEVLRAMTLAYQAAAFDAHITAMKAHPEDRTAHMSAKRYRYLLRISKKLWDLASLVAGNADADPMVFPLLREDPRLQADYMERLTGKRAHDAPPAET